MPLSEFAQAGLIVTVFSRGLDCRVLFVSDNVPESALGSLTFPVYRAHELLKLARLSPPISSLRTINEVKQVFGVEAAVIEAERLQDPAQNAG